MTTLKPTTTGAVAPTGASPLADMLERKCLNPAAVAETWQHLIDGLRALQADRDAMMADATYQRVRALIAERDAAQATIAELVAALTGVGKERASAIGGLCFCDIFDINGHTDACANAVAALARART